ncbi:MAG TPA: hypothetical protein VGB57_09595 [Allosphingosinicella sp.]|jgi:SOS-response transcriptional repressor LexA
MRYSRAMGEALPIDPTGNRRLKPTMRSRKLQALDFIKRYFAEWGHSPSLDEIGAALEVSKQRASELVQQLCDEDQIQRVVGKRRGIVLIDRGEQLSEADVLLRIKQLGWSVNASEGTVGRTLTQTGLPDVPELDYKG